MQFAHKNGIPVENASVLYSGIDVQKFHLKSQNVFKKRVNILVPGRITPIKGTKDALSLFVKLKKEKIPINLTIIGKTFSKPYFCELQQIIQEIDLRHEISLLPMVSHEELVRIYQASDICFFPSYQKHGLSRVPLEAMASGCLVISYGNEGSNEIIQHLETGLLVSEGNIQLVAEWIKTLIEEPSAYWRMIQAARKKVEFEHNLDNYIDLIENILKDSLSKSILNKVINSSDKV